MNMKTAEPTLETTGRTLDHAAEVYDLLSPLMTFGREEHYRKLALRHLNLQGHERVLDVGCGTGILTRQIAARLNTESAVSIGIDAAPNMIRVARKKAKNIQNIQFKTALAEKLPYEDASFDCAVSTFFFHHIDYDLKLRSLNELWRTLKPGGTLLIVDVDVPTHWFGRLCAWSGYWLFKQEEIRENIEGKLRLAMDESLFPDWQICSRHTGYITIFKLQKP